MVVEVLQNSVCLSVCLSVCVRARPELAKRFSSFAVPSDVNT